MGKLRIAVVVAALVALSGAAMAAPLYQMRTDGSGIPLILIGNSGYGGWSVSWLGMSNDGYVSAYDTRDYGNEFHVLDPALQSPNNAATSAEVALVQVWDANRDGPDEPFTMTSEVVAVDGDTAVVRVEVHYGGDEPQAWRDLWVMRFAADRRCAHFEEWPIAPPRGD